MYIETNDLDIRGREIMSNNDAAWATKYDHWSAKKSDEQLIQVIEKANKKDIDYEVAIRVLHDRYQKTLLGYFDSMAFKHGWNKKWIDFEDVAQETWHTFFEYAKINTIQNFRSSLLTFANRRFFDALRRNYSEVTIELDHLSPELSEASRMALQIPMEEEIENATKSAQLHFLEELPYGTSLLSDCERVYWIMRERMEIPTQVIAKLTGRSEGNIYQALHRKRKRVREFMEGPEFEVWLAKREATQPTFKPKRLIERFWNPMPMNLTPDELNESWHVVAGYPKKRCLTLP